MRKPFIAIAALALAAVGAGIPATTAQADELSVRGPGCNAVWPDDRNGNVYAWSGRDCTGIRLGYTQGDDANWATSSDDDFYGSDNDNAESVMNAGYPAGEDVVAFYRHANYAGGYGCLDSDELYADDLRDNYFTGTNISMDNQISSHRWVYPSGCLAGSWIS
ncbi:hypothetical protein AB0L99_22645 [Streptomyces sp. NPDC051954]|uniref:hypothetical protein n=1 Tax=unclassified Streptomyces TaxID=2593676 RepID=UPI00342623AC